MSLPEELNTSFPIPSKRPLSPVVEVQEVIPKEVVRQEEGQANMVGPSYPVYDGRYLELPYTITPNLEVSGETSWTARKLHYHAIKPLLSKKAVNGTFVLASRAALLARESNNAHRQVDILKKRVATKNLLIKDKDKELSTKKLELEELSNMVKE
ncbi:hypothetical protein LIER_01154 [Lithospermum erythrorhizon]|uniref:Uncharacterized protein n=1 Tax=Lithospermum erythrorhizon TaxID=34254 RepID=A0AAV3NPG5_LITER